MGTFLANTNDGGPGSPAGLDEASNFDVAATIYVAWFGDEGFKVSLLNRVQQHRRGGIGPAGKIGPRPSGQAGQAYC
ncbi:MAG: hypothetical protein ACK53L_24785, partial [Pirellulaceae bacterium]